MTAISEVEIRGLTEAVRHIPAAVAIVDLAGGLLYENERARSLVRGHPGAPLPSALAATTLRSGHPVIDAESSHVRADGARGFTRWSCSPLCDGEGRIAAAVVVIADVTAEKLAESRVSYFDAAEGKRGEREQRLLSATSEQPQSPVRILLVEDHAAVREAIAAMFEREPGFTVVGQAGSLAEAREMLARVDVAVLDLSLPDGVGSELITELHAASPNADALVLSAGLDPTSIARAVQNGAAGVLDKAARLDELLEAVTRLRAGDTLLSRDEIVEFLSSDRLRREVEHADRGAIETVTERELDVLRLLAEGLDSRAIAGRLHISERTERNHVANILGKLGVHSRLQAVVFALRYGVVEIPRSAS
jgi:DNA-binding NarL/FixJ family response regulator